MGYIPLTVQVHQCTGELGHNLLNIHGPIPDGFVEIALSAVLQNHHKVLFGRPDEVLPKREQVGMVEVAVQCSPIECFILGSFGE